MTVASSSSNITESFHTKTGFQFAGLQKAAMERMRCELVESYGISHAQIVEASSYSMAMVVRFALGLSATGGAVIALVNDSLAGWVAVATARHLANAGAKVTVVTPFELTETKAKTMPELSRQLAPLSVMGIDHMSWTSAKENEFFNNQIQSSHNVICGLFAAGNTVSTLEDDITTILNEAKTPVHTVEAPIGLDVDSGQPTGKPLFASSTLSLGAPYKGLYFGNDYVGRHYVCDISLTKSIYEKEGVDLTCLFAEQPVIQVFSDRDAQFTEEEE